jgi:hypothetical protein
MSYVDNINICIDEAPLNADNIEVENDIILTHLNETYKQYFDMFTSIILKFHDSNENDQSLVTVIF